MIIDFHTHIFPEEFRTGRENFFPDEPGFRLLYDSPGSKLASAEEIVESMDAHGVDRSVVFGFPWQIAKTFKMHNDYIMESAARYPDRLIGFCCFDPFNAEAVPEILRCLDGGLSGVGELAFYQAGIDSSCIEKLTPIMEICVDKDLPVLIHTNEPVGHVYLGKSPNTLRQIYDLVGQFPDAKIVLAHWGGGIFFFNLLRREVKETLSNVYFDTAASPFLYDPDVYLIAKQIVGTEKILFGSDFPLLKPKRYFDEFKEAGLSAEDKARVCGGNAVRLLRI
ncbi:MAG: amidohydrolase [Deltaproteobacteria bacterium]|nr:amidohydrolase [Deltaproteobacteria bacterium]